MTATSTAALSYLLPLSVQSATPVISAALPTVLLPFQRYCCPSFYTYFPTAARIYQEMYVWTTRTIRACTPLREDPDPRTLDLESERTPHWSENLKRGIYQARYRSENHGARTMERELGARILERGSWIEIYGAKTLDWTLDRNPDLITSFNQKA